MFQLRFVYVGIAVSWSREFIGVLRIERGVVILSRILRQHVLPELIQPLQKRVVALHRSGDVSLSEEGRTQAGDAVAPVARGIVDRGRRGGVRGQHQLRTSQLILHAQQFQRRRRYVVQGFVLREETAAGYLGLQVGQQCDGPFDGRLA